MAKRIQAIYVPRVAAVGDGAIPGPEWTGVKGAVDALTGAGPVVRADVEFGIRPHATTDQTAAINSMIEQLAAAGGAVVHLASGTYRAHVVLRSGVWLVTGAPMRGGPVTLKGLGTDWVVDTHVDAGGDYTYGMGLQGLYIEGASRTTPATASGGGVRFGPMSAGGGLYGVHVSWLADQGILMEAAAGNPRGAGSNQIAQCYVENVTLNRSRSALIGAIEDRGVDNQWRNIEASTSQSATEGAIGTGGPYGAGWCVAVLVAAGSASTEWTNVVGQLSDHGFVIDGQAHRLTDCRGDLSYAHDWVIDSSNCVITGALALNGGRAANNTYDAFLLTSGSLGNRLSGEAVQNGGRTYKYNVEDLSNYGASDPATYQNLIDVTGYGYATAPYKMGSAVPRLQGQVAAPTSGTTWNVAHAGLVVPNYASAATVTAFTGGVKGQVIEIVGDGKVSIQHNGTIRTGTGGTILLASERVYRFRNIANSGNGYWLQVGGAQARLLQPVAGATTWNVSGTSHVKTANTAATTVTAITGASFGDVLHVLGDGFTTIQHNGTQRMAGGANLLLAADKAYSFVNWSTISTPYWVQE